MIAVDTNIVVRLITEDDVDQVARARALILERGGLIQMTVLLETEWVLRSVYRYGRDQIVSAFAILAQTEALTIEQSYAVQPILQAYAAGMDFADAIHLAGSEVIDGFASFDKLLVQTAPRYFPGLSVVSP